MSFSELNSRFDIEPAIVKDLAVIESEPVEDDIEHARNTLRDLIDKGNEAIDGIGNLARNSDAPRAYEVMGQLIKTVSDVTKDLVAVQKAKAEIERPKIASQTNNVFVGSTHELMKMLKDAQKNIEEQEP